MRRRVTAVVVVALVALALAGGAGGDQGARRVALPGRLSVEVPPRWHLLRGWLSDVIDPAPRLAIASFPARLSRRTCECGFPNVVDFPRGGAFVFVWEYGHVPRRALARVPRRPGRFAPAGGGGVRLTCDGPSNELLFRDAGREFEVLVYLGPAAGSTLRAETAAVLDSLRVGAGGSGSAA